MKYIMKMFLLSIMVILIFKQNSVCAETVHKIVEEDRRVELLYQITSSAGGVVMHGQVVHAGSHFMLRSMPMRYASASSGFGFTHVLTAAQLVTGATISGGAYGANLTNPFRYDFGIQLLWSGGNSRTYVYEIDDSGPISVFTTGTQINFRFLQAWGQMNVSIVEPINQPIFTKPQPPAGTISLTNTIRITIYLHEPHYYPPIITASDDLYRTVSDPLDLTAGIAATWGVTLTNTIPTQGNINALDPAGDNFQSMTESLLTYDFIGKHLVDYEIRDDHSLSNASLYSGDTTMTPVSRHIIVSTPATPTLSVKYGASAVARNSDTSISGAMYDSESPLLLPCGGEDGWTNQPLDIYVDPDSIVGKYDTVLRPPVGSPIVSTGMGASLNNYNIDSTSALGSLVEGELTAIGEAGVSLSGVANGVLKIDTTPPYANANYVGGFGFNNTSVDNRSGISTVTYPTQIAFTPPTASMTAPESGWANITSHTLTIMGNYDVWVRATDKAGNETTRKVYANLYIGGDVSITKNTDKGAVLHAVDCPDFDSISITSCGLDCSVGASRELEGETAFTYEITLTNTAAVGNAAGTYEDYLPEGVAMVGTPTATASGSGVATITSALHHTGRYRISGWYGNLTPGQTITITIPCETPEHDEDPGATNILRNQMESTWTIGSGATAISRTTLSNHANHRVRSQGVATTFTKVKAEDITTGIAGAEFALYRWDGALDPTQAELEHIIDTTGLTDGDWTRVTLHGVDATSPSDVFESAILPLGEVVIGNLQEGIYSLVETRAPSGYELPIGQWVLTIEPTASDTPGDYKIEFVGKSQSIMPPAAVRETSGGVHSYKIINARPFTIGMSGLGGTASLLLAGFVLMAVAGNAYVAYSYKQNKKTKE